MLQVLVALAAADARRTPAVHAGRLAAPSTAARATANPRSRWSPRRSAADPRRQGRHWPQNPSTLVVTVDAARPRRPARRRRRPWSSGWPRSSGPLDGARPSARVRLRDGTLDAKPTSAGAARRAADPGRQGRRHGGRARPGRSARVPRASKAGPQRVREYPQPLGANAAHELGYLGPVTQDELDRDKGRRPADLSSDLVGKAGLEAQYDADLRGKSRGKTHGRRRSRPSPAPVRHPPTPGNYLVTNIDARVQAVTEDELPPHQAGAPEVDTTAEQAVSGRLRRRRGDGREDRSGHRDGELADVRPLGLGRRHRQQDYRRSRASRPTTRRSSRAPGRLRPGLDVQGGVVASGRQVRRATPARPVPLPSSLTMRTDRSSRTTRPRPRHDQPAKAIEVSCDTVFYGVAYDKWLTGRRAQPASSPGHVSRRPRVRLRQARLASTSRRGPRRIADRQGKYDDWKAIRSDACKGAQTRPPARDPAHRRGELQPAGRHLPAR